MIILVIIMIIFGAGKLPEIGSAFGNSIKNFKKSMKDADETKDDMDIRQNHGRWRCSQSRNRRRRERRE